MAWQTEKEANNEEATLTDSVIQGILTGKDYVEGDPGAKSFVRTKGNTILYADLYESPMTIAEAKELENGFDKNTILVDDFGNTIKVPEGFKIASDSATVVTGGVVIDDVNHGETAGSQFVWIPIGTICTNEEQTDYETIEFSRYTFDGSGNGTSVGANSISLSGYNFEELSSSTYGNAVAKDIKIFFSTAESSHGYYIARYEARIAGGMARDNKEDELGQITVKPNDYVYNYVTQKQAATLSQGMYSSTSFTSDLVNSYAWDTAIVFIQKFDDRTNKTKEYSMQTSLNTTSNIGLAGRGTNNEEVQYQDKVCNIWDMASNCMEWTTEAYSNPDYPCTNRGGNYNNGNGYTSVRSGNSTTLSDPSYAFRPILYL